SVFAVRWRRENDHAGARSGARPFADELRPQMEISRVEKPIGRYRHETWVIDVVIAIRVHQPTGLREQKPRLRVIRSTLGDVGALQDSQHLQQSYATRRRPRHTDSVLAIGTAKRLSPVRTISRQILQRHRARQRRLLGALDDLRRDTA